MKEITDFLAVLMFITVALPIKAQNDQEDTKTTKL